MSRLEEIKNKYKARGAYCEDNRIIDNEDYYWLIEKLEKAIEVIKIYGTYENQMAEIDSYRIDEELICDKAREFLKELE